MRRCLSFIGALALMAGSFASVAEAGLIFYNQNNPLTTTPSGQQGNYSAFSLTLNDVALTTDETGFHAGGPSAETYPTVKVQSIVLRRASGSGGTNNVFMHIYSGNSPTVGNLVAGGISTNSNNMLGSAGEGNVTFNFNSTVLSTTQNYFFAFSTSSTNAGSIVMGRIKISTGASELYGTGRLYNENPPNPNWTGNPSPTADAIFVINAIPEPSSLLMLGMVGLGAVVRRRRA